MPIETFTSPSMGHVHTRPTKGKASSYRLDVSGVMLRATTSICQALLFFPITMATFGL